MSDLTWETLKTLDAGDLNQRYKDTLVVYKDSICEVHGFERQEGKIKIDFNNLEKVEDKKKEEKKKETVPTRIPDENGIYVTIRGTFPDLDFNRLPLGSRILLLPRGSVPAVLTSFDSFLRWLGHNTFSFSIFGPTSLDRSTLLSADFWQHFVHAFGIDESAYMCFMSHRTLRRWRDHIVRESRWDIFSPGNFEARPAVLAMLRDLLEAHKVEIRGRRELAVLYQRVVDLQLHNPASHIPVIWGDTDLTQNGYLMSDMYTWHGNDFIWSIRGVHDGHPATAATVKSKGQFEIFDPAAISAPRLSVGWYEQDGVGYFLSHSTERQWHRGWCYSTHPIVAAELDRFYKIARLSDLYKPYSQAYRNKQFRKRYQMKDLTTEGKIKVLNKSFLIRGQELYYRLTSIGLISPEAIILKDPIFKQELEELVIQPKFSNFYPTAETLPTTKKGKSKLVGEYVEFPALGIPRETVRPQFQEIRRAEPQPRIPDRDYLLRELQHMVEQRAILDEGEPDGTF